MILAVSELHGEFSEEGAVPRLYCVCDDVFVEFALKFALLSGG